MGHGMRLVLALHVLDLLGDFEALRNDAEDWDDGSDKSHDRFDDFRNWLDNFANLKALLLGAGRSREGESVGIHLNQVFGGDNRLDKSIP